MPITQPPQTDRRRGAVLLISLALLALLSIFALAFVKLVKFERRAATNYTDAVRARMLARAGIQHAVVALQDIAGQRHYSDPRVDTWFYQLKAPPTSGANMVMTQVQREALNLKLDLSLTTEPSFKMSNLGPAKNSSLPSDNECVVNLDPAAGPIVLEHGDDGSVCKTDPVMYRAKLAISGVMGQTYDDGLDAYKLKVLDAASQLNLNQPNQAAAHMMLKNLLRSAAEGFADWNLNEAQADALASHVILNRRASGFRSKAEIQSLITVDPVLHNLGSNDCRCKDTGKGGLALTGIGADQRVTPDIWTQGLRDLVTVRSWVDEKVVRPWNLGPVDTIPTSHAYYEKGVRGLNIMKRAPVNLNTARKPVLVALMANLQARNDVGTFQLGYDQAGTLADEIIARREKPDDSNPTTEEGPFKSWLEFERWIDALPVAKFSNANGAVVAAGTSSPYIVASATDSNIQKVKTPASFDEGLVPDETFRSVSPLWKALDRGQGLRDMIKAQFNPNTMLNKFGQGVNLGGLNMRGMPIPRIVDKTDLTSMTTEGCFDSMGVFEITSLGMVLKQDEKLADSLTQYLGGTSNLHEMGILAAQTQLVVIKVYDVVRYTTQADFEQYRAMMSAGDFIADVSREVWQSALMGTNLNDEKIKKSNGWPSLVTNPVYSISRDNTLLHGIDSAYTPATYDGQLMLTNLLGVFAQPWDFISGFSRGTTDAFKARVWWDPKDQNPYPEGDDNPVAPGWPYQADALDPGAPYASKGVLPSDAGYPSHPKGVFPPNDVDGDELTAWYDGTPSPSGAVVNYSELDRLCDPYDPSPETTGLEGEDANPVDSKPGIDQRNGDWWHQGSSLWNNGVAVSPRRLGKSSGKPVVIAYNSDNMNLQRASSIRFWVQPLTDPYLKSEEVLCSFIGSRNGNRRDVGFRVIKRADVGGIAIVLQACPSNSLNKSGIGQEYRWHNEDGIGGVWRDEVEIDVRPYVARFGAATSSPLNPIEPEWLQNSWHWIVINYGYVGDNPPPGFPQFDMSLQVDMRPPQPPRSISGAEGAGRIRFAGDTGHTPPGQAGYGELHGHVHLATDDNPMTALPQSIPNVGASHIWLEPRPLGDFYNCRQGGRSLSAPIEINAGTVNLTAGAFDPVNIDFPPSTVNHKVFVVNGTSREEMTWDPGSQKWLYAFPADGVPPASVDLVMQYQEWIYSNQSEHCLATEVSGPGTDTWDGAAMRDYRLEILNPGSRRKFEPGEPYVAPKHPGNGDNQCVNLAEIHGRPSILCPQGLPCWVTHNGSSSGQGAVISGPDPIGTDFVCDGCRGCEHCDVDGPIFFGGEPVGATNFSGGDLAEIDKATMSYAVFDNIVIKNQREFEARTDFTSDLPMVDDPANPGFEIPDPNGELGTPKAPVDWFEDRYYETTTAQKHLALNLSASPDDGYGATYRRGLLDLIGRKTRLGSVTWTSYPTSDDRMQFEVIVSKLPGISGGDDVWKGDNPGALVDAKIIDRPGGKKGRSQIVATVGGELQVVGYSDGMAFGSESHYDGIGTATVPYDIMLLTVQLGKLYKATEFDVIDPLTGEVIKDLTKKEKFGLNTSTDEWEVTDSGLPTPITESPLFEDVTFNFLRETPQILYAEEGVSE